MHLVGAVAQLASKANDLGNDQLGDTAGVAEGGVEDGNTVFGGILEVHLVGTDTEAPDHDQVLSFLKDPSGELGLGADTDHMNVTMRILVGIPSWHARSHTREKDLPNLLNQLVLRERGLEEFDLVALLLQNIPAGLVDILQ